MIQFYKKRDFGSLISDTFSFFKQHGRNFFKNYILINGLLMILLTILFVVGYRSMFAQIFKGNLQGESYYLESYFQDNPITLVVGGLVFFVIFMAAMMVMYSFPVLYMKRISETGNTTITSDMMLTDLKKHIGKFFIFFLGMLLVSVPFTLVFLAVNAFLFIIGILLMFLVIPVLFNVVNFTLFDYFHTQNGFFASLSYALRSQFSYTNSNEGSPFWKYWGSTIIIYLIVTILSYIFTLIPMAIFFVALFTVPEAGVENMKNPSQFFEGTMGLIFFIIYGFSLIFMMLMMNLLYVNAGLAYYDSRSDLHRKIDIQEIETIGNSEV